jgi:hypothetical protein
MNLSRLRALFFSLISLVATAAYAVEQLPEKEEDIPVEYIPRLDYTVSIGVHRLSGGPKVRFGNLGHIPQPSPDSTDTTDTISKTYTNGKVNKDVLNVYEQSASGAPLAVGSTFSTEGWISVVSDTGSKNSNAVVNVFTAINTPQTKLVTVTNADGTTSTTAVPIKNPDGTYSPVTTPSIVTNPDGSTTITDINLITWARTQQFLLYQPNQTRSWTVTSQSQIDMTNKTVSMSTYGVESRGDRTVEADSRDSSGFEVSLERKLGQIGRLEWGVSGGLRLIEINAKASRVIQSNLVQSTDTYKMIDTGYNSDYFNGTAVDSNKNPVLINILQPTGNASDNPITLVDQYGKPITQYVSSTTAPSSTSQTAASNQSVVTPLDTNPNDILHRSGVTGVVDIQGFWQIKGAYYQIHLGPTFRYRFNDRFAVSGSVGASLGYVGTVFRVDEYYDNYLNVRDLTGAPMPLVDNQAASSVYQSAEQNTTHKFIPGLYGEFNAEYWVTERTGFYFGLTQQSMGHYTQNPLSGRTATIDMGKSSGWRLGIMTRF